MTHIRTLIGAVALVSHGLLLTSNAIAQVATPFPAKVLIEDLKSAYLQCERAAVSSKLATGDIMFCSVIYEELKQRAFGGEFTRLKAWADEHLRPAEANWQKARS